MTNYYFYTDANSQKQGPVTADSLILFAQQGTITPDTIVEDEKGKSVPAKQCKGLIFPETVQSNSIPPEPETTLPESESTESHQDVTGQPTALQPPVAEETAVPESAPDTTEHVLSELKPTLTTLEGKLDSLIEKLDSLVENIDFGTKFAEKKQEQIDKLYEENRLYKDNIIEKFKEKLVMGIIEQLAIADRMVSNFEEKEETEKNYNNLLEAFRELTDDFRTMLLSRFYVDAYCSEPGEMFEPGKHQALPNGVIFTEDETKKDKIVSSVRYGYKSGGKDGKILREEIVKVYRYHAPPVPPPESDSQTNEQTAVVPEPQHTQEVQENQEELKIIP